MSLNALIPLCLIAWPSVQGSRPVTLTCSSDHDYVMRRVIPGPRGKQGVAGVKGDAGEKGEKGQNDDSSAAIAMFERKVSQLENHLSDSQRAQHEERMKRQRNGAQVVVLGERVVQLEEKLADLESQQKLCQCDVQNRPSDSPPMNCRDVYASGDTTNGVYNITINRNLVQVYCDMETSGGGWTVFQKRSSREANFNYTWSMYKMGFGDLNENFWLGLDNIHHLTNSRNCKLHVDIWTLSNNEHQYAIYSNFSIEDESDNYRLRVSGYSGTAGDGLTEYHNQHGIHNNMQFTTKDRDNDRISGSNCASSNAAGWWFNACYDSCLNCRILFYWDSRATRSSTMKLRCD